MPFLKFNDENALGTAFDVKEELDNAAKSVREKSSTEMVMSLPGRERGLQHAVWYWPEAYLAEFDKHRVSYRLLSTDQIPEYLSERGQTHLGQLQQAFPGLFNSGGSRA